MTSEFERKQKEWDLYFLDIASVVKTKSKDPSTKCGAVIVAPDKHIVSTGWNGFPRRMPDNPDWYNNREEKYERVVHCEMNAVIQAKKDLAAHTLYTTGPCCNRCAVHMIQAGITRFVAWTAPDMLARWRDAFKKTFSYYNDCGVTHVEYDELTRDITVLEL